jgi:hypothetical protein
VRGEEAFEVAASVAAVAGIGILVLLCLVAVVGLWRLFRLGSDAMTAATRASLGMEQLARRLSREGGLAGGTALDQLRDEAESLFDQQRRLQEMARDLLDTESLAAGEPASLEEVHSAVDRLERTVGEMATSLANLIQTIERRQEG